MGKYFFQTHEDIHKHTMYVCPHCGLQLNTKRTLKMHMVVHSDQKRFKCQYCGNEYKRSKALKNHLILHTGMLRVYIFVDFRFEWIHAPFCGRFTSLHLSILRENICERLQLSKSQKEGASYWIGCIGGIRSIKTDNEYTETGTLAAEVSTDREWKRNIESITIVYFDFRPKSKEEEEDCAVDNGTMNTMDAIIVQTDPSGLVYQTFVWSKLNVELKI